MLVTLLSTQVFSSSRRCFPEVLQSLEQHYFSCALRATSNIIFSNTLPAKSIFEAFNLLFMKLGLQPTRNPSCRPFVDVSPSVLLIICATYAAYRRTLDTIIRETTMRQPGMMPLGKDAGPLDHHAPALVGAFWPCRFELFLLSTTQKKLEGKCKANSICARLIFIRTTLSECQ